MANTTPEKEYTEGPISNALEGIFEGDLKKIEGAARDLGDSSVQSGVKISENIKHHIKKLKKEKESSE